MRWPKPSESIAAEVSRRLRHRRTGPRLWRTTIPGDPASAQPFCGSHSTIWRGCGAARGGGRQWRRRRFTSSSIMEGLLTMLLSVRFSAMAGELHRRRALPRQTPCVNRSARIWRKRIDSSTKRLPNHGQPFCLALPPNTSNCYNSILYFYPMSVHFKYESKQNNPDEHSITDRKFCLVWSYPRLPPGQTLNSLFMDRPNKPRPR